MAAAQERPSLRNGSWYRCSDGTVVEPLDAIHFVFFPNHGLDATDENVCFRPKHMKWSFLQSYLPESSENFMADDFVDGVIALILVTVAVTFGFIAGKYIWEAVDERFRNVSPSHKKWYVVANISKSFFLGCMAISPKYWIGCNLCQILDKCQMLEVKRTMAIYIATDLAALYMVPKLPTSTILHHVTTTAMGFIVYGLNLQIKGRAGLLGLGKMCILYGSFSTIPFLVNAYLALRVVYPKSRFVKLLCVLSLITYMMCCGLNWSIHLLWILGYWGEREVSIITVVYTLMMMFLVHDDIVLLKWLFKQNSPVNEKTIEKKKD